MHNPYSDIDPPTPKDYRGVSYLPLPHVIRERTAEIRAEWSEQERRKREVDAMFPRSEGKSRPQHPARDKTPDPAPRDRNGSAKRTNG